MVFPRAIPQATRYRARAGWLARGRRSWRGIYPGTTSSQLARKDK
jgi:hypothetical protein